jgi:membrane-associated protease RseP (regulator of RpoE activity)
MNFDTAALLIFIALLGAFLIRTRSRLQTHSFLKIFYFCLYRTKLGMAAMERWARSHEKLLKKAGYVMIPVGFLGMLVMIEELFRGIITLLNSTEALTVGVVLPIQAKGVFYVPFFYWLIAIAFVMAVHEFGHGVIARAHRVKVKSTGFAFLGAVIPVVPGAFVEIDEKHLAKQSTYTQLSIFAAGPFVNIAFGVLFFIAMLVIQPAAAGMLAHDGMAVTSIAEGSPAAQSGLAVGEVLTRIDGAEIRTAEDFNRAFAGKQPNDVLDIQTDKGTRTIALGGTAKAVLGVQVEEATHVREEVLARYGAAIPAMFAWFSGLVFWLFLLNLGVGLFNLVPLGPIDGGRMLRTALDRVMHRTHARAVWNATSAVMLAIILTTVFSAFV